ncbi:MAG: GGDEF domain-containing protein, partial [Butyrivibrio sp.]|nr:GGDEF domain-containing protein [Butyrivibrio sp.]
AGQERESVITPDLLWRNVDLYSDQAYFWKDRDRRFVGANRKFLEYYGLSSVDEIIGKNDEEMGWHVNPLPFKSDEERVLETGERTQEVPGTCICNGEIRNIIASKMPIYDDGQIVGLMGTFRDVTDQLKAQEQKEKVVTTVDEQTGMLNFLGIIDAALHYQESYVTQGTDFAVIFLNIERFRYYNEKYGIKWGNALLTAVGQVLRFTVGVTGVTGRYSGDHFMVLTQCRSEADLRRMIDRIEQRVSKIEVIEGVPCTVYFKKGYARYSETNSLKDLYSLAEERSTG